MAAASWSAGPARRQRRGRDDQRPYLSASRSSAQGTLENAGTIGGGLLDAVYFDTAGAKLIVHPGAVFDGTVRDGGTGGGIIELTTGGAGTLDGLGTGFVGFETVTIAPDAAWTVGGTLAGFKGVTIKGFSTDDGLVLHGLAAGDTATLGAGNLVTIANASGATVGTVQLDGAVAGQTISLVADGQGGSTLLLCYLAGTRILTPTGEVAVEDLRIGDTVVTRWQGIQPIKWIGRQSFAERFLKGNRDRIPVRIKAGALGTGCRRATSRSRPAIRCCWRTGWCWPGRWSTA